ncbi:MAG: hypothetical protein BGN96_00325 [Bacteroidales bacterium 45-6]|nr:MAG: hypothetical protein BGN96_00325 [Bacteroidales bacterium 45-6]
MTDLSGSQNCERMKIKADDLADFLLDIGVFLMSSGAHCGRVWRNCKRIADHWGFHMNLNLTFTGMLVSVWDENDKSNAVTRYKTAPAHSVHFEILTLISHLSWKISKGQMDFAGATAEMEKIHRTKNYHYLIVAFVVGISCACLCSIAGGDLMNCGTVLVAASIGSVVRSWILKLKYNSFLSFIIASFVTTMIASLDTIFKLGVAPETALATAVLYLIPGVPLINSVIDLLEGYLAAAIARSLFAASIITCIAVGMTLSIMLLGIGNF